MANRDRGKDRKAADKAGLTPEDVALFHQTVADAKPLRPKPEKADAAKPDEARKPGGKAKAGEGAAATKPPDRAPPKPAMPDLAVGGVAGVDRRTADRLRRGKLAIDARLDLHGLYQDEAHRRLNDFIADSATAGRRCVLVITGRGAGREGGVLRRRVPAWLNQQPCRPYIVAVAQARPEHGGEGALYVMLRRRRGDA